MLTTIGNENLNNLLLNLPLKAWVSIEAGGVRFDCAMKCIWIYKSECRIRSTSTNFFL